MRWQLSKILDKKTEDVWIYYLEPGNTIAGLVLLVLSALFFLLFVLKHGTALRYHNYLFFVLIMALIFVFMTKKKILEINRRNNTIKTLSRILFFKKDKIRTLTDFDSIKICIKQEITEEGYPEIVYSLVLSGAAGSVEIVSVKDRVEAEIRLNELSTFLNLSVQNSAAELNRNEDNLTPSESY